MVYLVTPSPFVDPYSYYHAKFFTDIKFAEIYEKVLIEEYGEGDVMFLESSER